MELGNQIKTYRTNMNLSQEDLADRIYVTRQTISNWENNINEPKISYVISIAKFFNVSTDYLLGMDEETNTKTQ